MNIFMPLSRLQYLIALIKLLCARLVACFYPNKNNTWLIAEKTNEARDNGYWFAKYMCENHPDEKIFYVISTDSADYPKISSLKPCKIVVPDSWMHKILFWSVRYNVVSQPPCDYFCGFRKLLWLRRKNQVNVFLQHGITKDNLDHSFDADKSGIDIFITSAKREHDAVMRHHGYDERQCALMGMCRFDNLRVHNGHNKIILVMPTFRHWLMCSDKNGIASQAEQARFKDDDYFKCYMSLLTSPKLITILEQYGYRLIFYPHYCAQPFLSAFDNGNLGDNVILASKRGYDVQKLLLEADILVTDYSSVFFDFAYLKKPEIFFQFDVERFRGNHYKEGYFSYARDGFGPVMKEEDDVIDYLSFLIKNNCVVEKKYLERIDNFFQHIDHSNCQRTYEYIVNFNKTDRLSDD